MSDEVSDITKKLRVAVNIILMEYRDKGSTTAMPIMQAACSQIGAEIMLQLHQDKSFNRIEDRWMKACRVCLKDIAEILIKKDKLRADIFEEGDVEEYIVYNEEDKQDMLKSMKKAFKSPEMGGKKEEDNN